MDSLIKGNHAAGAQYIEDLATAYWVSEALFTAVEMQLFTCLEPDGMSLHELSAFLQADPCGLARFMRTLAALGLVAEQGDKYINTPLACKYLVAGKDNYQGDSVLWRKELSAGWRNLRAGLQAGGRVYPAAEPDEEQTSIKIRRFITAMDCVAKTKAKAISSLFVHAGLSGEILDVGAGSGAVSSELLASYPGTKATLLDLDRVLELARQMFCRNGLHARATFISANLLEEWPVPGEAFKLVIVSNLIHVYSEKEVSFILSQAVRSMSSGGILLIHDFFTDYYPLKASLFDLNMFIHTYNGKVFDSSWVNRQLTAANLATTGLMPLSGDTGIIIAAKEPQQLVRLRPRIRPDL